MKLNQNKSSTPPQTSEIIDYYNLLAMQNPGKATYHADPSYGLPLQRPNPPTPEAVAKAQFVDKTYQWTGK